MVKTKEAYEKIGKAIVKAIEEKYPIRKIQRYGEDRFLDEIAIDFDDLDKLLKWAEKS